MPPKKHYESTCCSHEPHQTWNKTVLVQQCTLYTKTKWNYPFSATTPGETKSFAETTEWNREFSGATQYSGNPIILENLEFYSDNFRYPVPPTMATIEWRQKNIKNPLWKPRACSFQFIFRNQKRFFVGLYLSIQAKKALKTKNLNKISFHNSGAFLE
jgi:hypothetical protein